MNTDCVKIPGYEFWIQTDGKRAKQYQTEETNEPGSNVVSCYIASEAGQEFRIGIRRHEGSQAASIRSYLNDDCVDKRVFRTPRENYVSHIYTAKDEKRRFAFSKINFEEDELAGITSVPQNLGTIRLEVFRIAKLRQTHSGPPPVTMLNTPTLSEKSKVISLHTTTLLKPEAAGAGSRNYYTNDYIDSKESPWYTVKFFYRPLGLQPFPPAEFSFEPEIKHIDTLQAEGIAPAPAPMPAPSGEVHGRGERNLRRDRRPSDSIEDRKPLVKTVKSEVPKADASLKASREEPIVIEDSDEEHLPNKRSRGSLNLEARRKKQKVSDPVVIVLDSD